MKKIITIILICTFVACKKTTTSVQNTNIVVQEAVVDSQKYQFDLQGHRGARGLLPENTLLAFKEALSIGVNTIELDVVITKDNKVLVSHEPWLNANICLDSLGNKIPKKEAMRHNIYRYNYREIQKIDCGSIGNPRFPNQKKVKATKPLLSEVIDLVEQYNREHQTNVGYNIEIKSDTRGDDLYHPKPSVFSEMVIAVLKEKSVKNHLVIQSFDTRVLEYIHRKHPTYHLAYLVEKGTLKENLSLLTFVPKIYSPDYHLLSEQEIKDLHQQDIKVIPWTVNDKKEMIKLLTWKVDGIITDYPNIAKQLHK